MTDPDNWILQTSLTCGGCNLSYDHIIVGLSKEKPPPIICPRCGQHHTQYLREIRLDHAEVFDDPCDFAADEE